MSTTLTQSAAAAFPDRPRAAAGVQAPLGGLRVQLQPGGGGGYLEHALSAVQPVVHVRFCFNPGTLAAGSSALCRAIGSTGISAFTLSYDPATGQLSVRLGDGQTLTATLAASLAWHVLEVGLDTIAGEAQLWINGVQADQTAGTFTAYAVARCWLGAFFKDVAATGEIALDEWVIADDYIGVVATAPASVYAHDPARWLVIYNRGVSDSVAWAEHYRSVRGLPYANLLGLALPSTETIDGADFETMRGAILDYLAAHELESQVVGFLLGHGVPGYVEPGAPGLRYAIPALLHRADGQFTALGNPLATDAVPARPTAEALAQADLRFTARVDAADLASAVALVDRAAALQAMEPLSPADCGLYVDPYTTPGGLVDAAVQRLTDWTASVDRMRTRLSLQLPPPSEPLGGSGFDVVRHDGFFWGWGAATPPSGFFGEPAGARAFCVQLDPEVAAAPTLREEVPLNWVATALDAGYAAAAGATQTFSASDVPLARPFFEALRRGWTLGEAWLLACPYLRQGMFLVGDPLLQLSFPRAGWDVHGPLQTLEATDWGQPLLAVGDAQRTAALPAAAQPSDGNAAMYLLQHLDEQGRADHAASVVRVATVGGAAVAAPAPPLWPDVEAWPVRIEDGQVRVAMFAGQPLSILRVTQVQIVQQDSAQAVTIAATPTFAPHADRIEWMFAPPAAPVRYRWRLRGGGGAVVETPWSSWVVPASAASIPLTDLIAEY